MIRTQDLFLVFVISGYPLKTNGRGEKSMTSDARVSRRKRLQRNEWRREAAEKVSRYLNQGLIVIVHNDGGSTDVYGDATTESSLHA